MHGGRFSSCTRWFLKWGLPYGLATLAAYLTALWLDHHNTPKLLALLVCWAGENGGYYVSAYICEKFLPTEDRIFQESAETLKVLLLIETLDSTVRFGLMWLCPIVLGNQEQGVALGSLIADIVFAVSLRKSRRLLEIFELLTHRSELVELRLSYCPAF